MSSIGRTVGKKAAKATVRHSVRGTVSKAQRKPLRTGTLLIMGLSAGVVAGWFAGRRAA